VTGEAEVNIRKGKTILVYDFSLEVEWEASRGSDEASGTYKVNEIAPDDLDDIHVFLILSYIFRLIKLNQIPNPILAKKLNN